MTDFRNGNVSVGSKISYLRGFTVSCLYVNMSQQIPPDHGNHETTIAICRTCQNLLNFICKDKVTNKKFPGIATHPNANSNHCKNAGV